MHLEDVRSYDYVNYVVPALHQLHRALRLLVSRLQRLYIDYAVRRHDVVFWAYDYFDYYLD
jgi:hypothetical protein